LINKYEVIMLSRILPKIISAVCLVAAAALLCALAPFASAQTSGSGDAQTPQLDYEFFKTRVEPIFLKYRSADHARCYTCHQVGHHGGGPLSLDTLSPGATSWTEEQSRHNFEVVSKLVVPGNPSLSLLLRMPMAPEAGGLADTHQGGRQFANEDDPDWENMKAWVLGQKLGSSSKSN
jgi:hypothetical protein